MSKSPADMTPVEFMEEVESNYDLASIKCKNTQVWPVLRQAYYSQHAWLAMARTTQPALVKARDLFRLRNVFLGISRWLRRYKYIVFSSTDARKQIQGKYINQHTNWLCQVLGRSDVLTIEFAKSGKHYKRDMIPDHNVVSRDIFSFFAVIPFVKYLYPINNVEILNEINKQYSLNVDYRMVVAGFFLNVSIFKMLFTVWRPQAIFLVCYYGIVHQAAIYAASTRNIPSVDIQHGLINFQQPTYRLFCKLDRHCFPDYLFAFGTYVKNIFEDYNSFLPPESVYPVGNGYINYIRERYEGSAGLFEKLSQYKTSITVTGQTISKDALLAFINAAAQKSPDILYIYIPRIVENNICAARTMPNVVMFSELSFQQIVKYTDFHATINSTCCLEAPALGTPNIMINIDGLAEAFYKDMLIDCEVTRFADTVDQFVEVANTWNRLASNEIIHRHSMFYAQCHIEALRIAVNSILTQDEAGLSPRFP